MANKTLFSSKKEIAPVADTVNSAGGKAYKQTDYQAIAQIACTNCFNNTFYVNAEDNLNLVKKVVSGLRNDPTFVAKVAVYCRDKAYMKDMPAYLCAVLAAWGEHQLFRKVFSKVIDNGKMLRNFVQIGRSGAAGKKLNMSSGAIRHAIRDWFKDHNSDFIFRASIGNDPSMRDILRMARPKPESDEKAALYAYLKGSEIIDGYFVTKDSSGNSRYANNFNNLPAIVKQYELFKKTHKGEIPNVDFRMLDSVLSKDELTRLWERQAEKASFTTTRMNLNNFSKYGVFNNKELTNSIVRRLSDTKAIKDANVYPYQLMTAYMNATDVPKSVKEALQDAMEISLDNIPKIEGGISICVDTSGSMDSPVTGYRVGSSSVVSCVDVASLFASALLRNNKEASVLPFDTRVHACNLNPRDTVITNSRKLASFDGGGTDCSCALRQLNSQKVKDNVVVFISDNESWVDNQYRGTGLLTEWNIYKKRNPKAKLICIDLTPRNNSQVKEHKDILQVGGFGDSVFDVINSFVSTDGDSKNHWVDVINKVSI